MIFNKKTYTVFDYLDCNWSGDMKVSNKDSSFFFLYGKDFTSLFKKYIPFFKQNIYLVSKDFHSAAEKAAPQLIGLLRDIADNNISGYGISGCFIIGDRVHMIRHFFEKDHPDCTMVYFVFDRSGMPLSFYVDDIKQQKGQFGWVSNSISETFGIETDDNIKDFIFANSGRIITLDMFRTYASVETVVIPPKTKKKILKDQHKNEFDFSITHLDSVWFTNIVRQEGFLVSGHFRLQPFGENLSKRKIIWIDEFEKHGYNRRATKNIK